jgi:hypothetical protein
MRSRKRRHRPSQSPPRAAESRFVDPAGGRRLVARRASTRAVHRPARTPSDRGDVQRRWARTLERESRLIRSCIAPSWRGLARRRSGPRRGWRAPTGRPSPVPQSADAVDLETLGGLASSLVEPGAGIAGCRGKRPTRRGDARRDAKRPPRRRRQSRPRLPSRQRRPVSRARAMSPLPRRSCRWRRRWCPAATP